MTLSREIKVSKKIILILILLTIVIVGLSTTYAYFQVNIIKDQIVVIRTANISINTTISGSETPSFTLNSGETKSITVNLSTELTDTVGYKMYYNILEGASIFKVTSSTSFPNSIVEGDVNISKEISFTFENIGEEAITLNLGTQGGIKGYPILLEQGNELILDKTLATSGVSIKNAILATIDDTNSIEEDDITYISGDSENINFNYVWYSGKLWRITAINSDGTLKMITDDAITNVVYDSVYTWLNEDFLDTLYNYQELIVTDSKWNLATSSSIDTKLPISQEDMLIGSVGLLNSYEFYQSYHKINSPETSYLNIGYIWWLLNQYDSNRWCFGYNDNSSSCNSTNSFAVRPSINLKADITILDGIGSKQKPYIINGDREKITINSSLINTRSSGEYVTFNNELYRIVDVQDGITKINKNDYVKENSTVVTKKFSRTASTISTIWGSTPEDQNDGNDYWDYYLNYTWYNNLSSIAKSMLVENVYYTKPVNTSSLNYKNAICKNIDNTIKECEKVDEKWDGYVGLLRYGEMFATQQGEGHNSSTNMWLITPYDESHMWYVDLYNNIGSSENPSPTSMYAIRPTLNLKSTIKIIGGEGTKEKPYILG